MEQLDQAHAAIGQIVGNDGRPVVEDQGVDTQLCTTWREALSAISDDLAYWSRRYKQANGLKADAARTRPAEEIEPEGDAAEEDWDDSDEPTRPAAPIQ